MYQYSDLSIPYNQPYVDNLWDEKQAQLSQNNYSKNPQQFKEKENYAARRNLTLSTLSRMEKIISDTITQNNKDLYDNLKRFIIELNKLPTKFDSQVPTALILTSSESASSIDTQFDELKKVLTRINARVVILDDKKCGNTKNAIDHIIKQLHICYGVNYPEKRGQVRSEQQQQQNKKRVNNEDQRMSQDSNYDQFKIEIAEDLDSEEVDEEEDSYFKFDVDEEEEIKNSEQGERKSSDYVSSLRNPSFGGGNNLSSNNHDSLLMNQTIVNQDVEMNVPTEDQLQKGVRNAGESSL